MLRESSTKEGWKVADTEISEITETASHRENIRQVGIDKTLAFYLDDPSEDALAAIDVAGIIAIITAIREAIAGLCPGIAARDTARRLKAGAFRRKQERLTFEKTRNQMYEAEVGPAPIRPDWDEGVYDSRREYRQELAEWRQEWRAWRKARGSFTRHWLDDIEEAAGQVVEADQRSIQEATEDELTAQLEAYAKT